MNKLKDTRVFGDLIVDDSITKNNKEVATEEYVDTELSAKQDKLTLNSGQVLGRTSSGSGSPQAINTINISQIKVSDLDDGSLYALKTEIPTVTTYSGSTSITLSNNSFQRAALTGDVTASANNNATTIANNVVTFAKMQNIATQKLLGRYTTGTGNVEPITLGNNLTLTTGGVLSATNTVYTHPNSGVTAGTYRSVTVDAKGHVTAGSTPTTLTGYGITLTGDVSNSSNEITIEPKAISLSKIQDIATGKVLGRTTSGSGVVEEISLININDLGLAKQVTLGGTDYTPTNGVITLPAYPTVTTYSGSTSITLSGTSFRRAALTGDVTAAANNNATTIANNAVTFAKMQNISTGKVLGRTTSGTGAVEEISLININDLGLGTGWTQVWSGSINLNSYINSYYQATVPSNSYIGKRIAIEVQYSTGTTYTSNIIFGVLGSSSAYTASTSVSKGIGWNYFDGTYLRVKTLFTYTSTSNTTTINVGRLKTLFGKFTGTTIEWSTSYSETLYMRKIWVIE